LNNFGKNPPKSKHSVELVLLEYINSMPCPPIELKYGSSNVSIDAIVKAASTAFPPFFRTLMPSADANILAEETAPLLPDDVISLFIII